MDVPCKDSPCSSQRGKSVATELTLDEARSGVVSGRILSMETLAAIIRSRVIRAKIAGYESK
jgi:hypothetical protein